MYLAEYLAKIRFATGYCINRESAVSPRGISAGQYGEPTGIPPTRPMYFPAKNFSGQQPRRCLEKVEPGERVYG